MLLIPNVQIILFIDFIFFILLFISLTISTNLVLKWNFASNSQVQYGLEKQSYLVSTIVKYIFFMKLPLFLFFIYSLDSLSDLIVGAMCSAGVIDSSSYGIPLVILKLVNLYFFGFWLIIHYGDLKFKDLRLTRFKFSFLIVASISIIFEIILEFLMFESIDLAKIAVCCGSLFSNASVSYLGILFEIDTWNYLYIFYLSFILLFVSFLKRHDYMYSFLNIIFITSSILSLIMFFSPYIYELPTHHCPFCILQKEYFYIGYFLYISLFLGTFFGIALIVSNMIGGQKRFYYNFSFFFICLYVAFVTYFPVSYYLRNGVLL